MTVDSLLALADRSDWQRPIRPSTLTDSCYERLRTAISTLEFRPGTPLSENELAHRFGISKSPVREALQRLSRDGLVTLEPNRRCVVASLDIPSIMEWYELRLILEPASLKKVSGQIPSQAIDDLRASNDLALEAFHQSESIAFIGQTDHFHTTLIGFNPNRSLVEFVGGLFVRTRRVRIAMSRYQHDRLEQDQTYTYRVLERHVAVLDNLERGDYDAAVELLRWDIQHSIDHLDGGDLPTILSTVSYR